ncbi:MAG TPA: glycosyltransferase family 39 protein [Gaiellaceae bacterium]
MTRRVAYPVVAALCALPRLGVLLHERDAIASGAEKSATFAQVFVENGTFGFLPGQPSAYTQPLYGWFLIPVEWAFGRQGWLGIGLAQIVVAVAVALLVYEIGVRFLAPRWAVLAAAIATLQPYLVWHDVHINREIVDQLCAAALVLLTLLVVERPTRTRAALLGVVTGLALLGNTRLVAIPLVIAVFVLAARRTRAAAVAAALVLAGAAVAVAPWVVRNKVNVGCWAITTDGRAFWKANNSQTYDLLSSGKWIDDVAKTSPRPPEPAHLTPEEARGIYDRTQGRKVLHPDECTEMDFYTRLAERYIRHHPGAKLKLAALSEQLLWQPNVIETGSSSGGVGKQIVEPAWMWTLYALAAVGLFVVPRLFLALAIALFAYQSFWAALFVGATRYRIAFDFLLALLATAAVARLWERRRA